VRGQTIRNVTAIQVRGSGDLVVVTVTANAFLRRMVRSLVAVLLEVGRGRMAPEAVDELLDPGRRALHGRAAPARGLTLERIGYGSISRTHQDNRVASAGRRTDRTDRTGEQGT
jgi:tRNA pseudouridine38-40 synthase